MRKLLLAILILALAFCQVYAFSDVPSTHWAASNIDFASKNGIVTGYPDGTFKPEASVTYEEAATMLYRSVPHDLADYSADYAELFEANNTASYAQVAISYFLHEGVIAESEVPGFNKGPAQGIAAPRATVAVWTAKALGGDLMGVYKLPYTDISAISAADMPYIDLLYRQGIMQGSLQKDGSVKFLPNDGVKRSEFAAISNRVYETLNADASAFQPEKSMVSFRAGLKDLKINSQAKIVVNGAVRAEGLSGLSNLTGEFRVSALALSADKGMQVHLDDRVNSRSGKVASVDNLGDGYKLMGISSGSDTVYYLVTPSTEGAVSVTAGRTVTFIADGCELVEIAN